MMPPLPRTFAVPPLPFDITLLQSSQSRACAGKPGYTGPNGGQCAACAAGTYKLRSGPGACSACPSGSSAPAASTSFSDCT